MSKFSTNQEVYDIHGRAGSYIAKVGSGHVVQPIFDDEDGEPRYADPETWSEVFATPPTERLHADIAKLEARLRECQDRLHDCQMAKQAAEREHEYLRKRIASQPDLSALDLWLQGKVTHIVSLTSYGLSIGTVSEVLTRKDGYETSLRLLALSVDPKANKFWVNFSNYNDGSGGTTRCLLATSIEHAVQLASGHLAECERRADMQHELVSMARCAMKYGVVVSDELRAKVTAEDRANAARHLEGARKEFERARLNLEAKEQAARAAGGAA